MASHHRQPDAVMSAPTRNDRPLDGKVAVLTGVSRPGQVGEVVARSLAERGASVVLIDRTGVEAEARAAELRDRGLRANAARADLTDSAQLDAVAAAVARDFGAVDALVNIAGGFSMSGKVADSDPDAWSRQLGIGLTTAYLTTRATRRCPLFRFRRRAAGWPDRRNVCLRGLESGRDYAHALRRSGRARHRSPVERSRSDRDSHGREPRNHGLGHAIRRT